MSLAAQQSVFTWLLRYWGLDAPAAVAHDFGGAVALRSALLDGMGYERLVLLDAVSVRPWGSDFFGWLPSTGRCSPRCPPHLHEAVVGSYIATASHVGLAPAVQQALVRPWLGEQGQAAFYRQIAQADERYTREVEDRYGERDCPVLIAWGSEDTAGHLVQELSARIQHARLHWIGRVGHLVQEAAPGHLSAVLVDFLAGA